MVFGFVFLVVLLAGIQHLCTSSTRSLLREDLQVGGKANNGLLTHGRRSGFFVKELNRIWRGGFPDQASTAVPGELWVLLRSATRRSCAIRGGLGAGPQAHLSRSHQRCSPLMGSIWLGRWLVWWHRHMRPGSCLPMVPPSVNLLLQLPPIILR